MRLKAPTSEQRDSMDFLFRTRNHHKDNFLSWLEDCREAAVAKVISSDPQITSSAVGELAILDDLLKFFKSI